MGREVRRVPLDFDWPMDKVWPGFCYTTPDCGIETCPDRHDTELPWSKEGMCTFHLALWDAESGVQFDPPRGDGWQLWETVSEGSPISPVFPCAERLARWMASPQYRWALQKLTYEQALAFIEAGWAPSFIYTPQTGLVPGEAAS